MFAAARRASPMMRAVATSALRAGGASAHSLSDPKYVERMYKEVPEELGGTPTARSAMKASCYHRIDFKIDEDASVFEAVQRFAAYNIGCLCVTTNGRVTGVISERDYVNKIALLGRKSQETRVKEIATMGANLVVASGANAVATRPHESPTLPLRQSTTISPS